LSRAATLVSDGPQKQDEGAAAAILRMLERETLTDPWPALPCSTLKERPIFSLRRRTKIYADTAILVLQAHAAQITN
jgi:hypothetical protein